MPEIQQYFRQCFSNEGAMNMKNAAIMAEGAYNTVNGKTAHGLVRFSQAFTICGVIDSHMAGQDAGEVLDGMTRGIPIYSSFEMLVKDRSDVGYLIIGVATEGGYLPAGYREVIRQAIERGMHIVNGLHQGLSDDFELRELAKHHQVDLLDVRKIFNSHTVFYTGKIKEVSALKVAVLGTDSIIGKRTTAIMLHQTFRRIGKKSTFVGLGQTGWMQGFKHCIVMDAIVNDFVTGAIEDVIWQAWKEENPEIIVTHGEGALFHPAYPGGFELIAAGKPDYIVLQHAPQREHFIFFPHDAIPALTKNIQMIELLSGKMPVATTIHTEGLSREDALQKAREIESEYGILTRVPAYQGVESIAAMILDAFGQKIRPEAATFKGEDELDHTQLDLVAGGKSLPRVLHTHFPAE